MAIVFESSTCALCGALVRERPYTATSGVAFESTHPLFRYCDAPLHFDCLERWPQRVAFSQAYFFGPVAMSVCVPPERRALLYFGGELALLCGPATPPESPYYAEVLLRQWPCRLYSKLAEWPDFVAGGYRTPLVGEALVAAEQAMTTISTLAPDLPALEGLLADARSLTTRSSEPALRSGR